MNFSRASISAAMIGIALALGACGMTPMMSGGSALTAQLAGSSEVPPTTSNASGTASATLNKQTNELSWTVTYSGLSGPATAAHFHGPAMPGQNAGVVVPITGSLVSPIKGAAMLTALQAAEVTAGRWYVNVHTAANPNGEIRGQVTVQP